MNRILSLTLILSFSVICKANYYNSPPLGPWGLESSLIHAKATRRGANDDLNKVVPVNRKDKTKEDKSVEDVKSDLGVDELENAEEAFFHAVEEVEDAVVHALDDEVETFFPHREPKQSE